MLLNKVVIAEDDDAIQHMLGAFLGDAGFLCLRAPNGRDALRLVRTQQPDLLILDVMMPEMDGLEVARRVKGDPLCSAIPILMLTSLSAVADRVKGLEIGADDYLPKPFDLAVLLARVRGLLRRRDWARGDDGGPETARIGEVEVDFRAFELRSPSAGTTRLTLLEAMLLKLLVQKAGQVVSKGEILEKVWNVSPDTQTRAVDNFIVRLRRYIEDDPAKPRHLQTIRGIGYRFVANPE